MPKNAGLGVCSSFCSRTHEDASGSKPFPARCGAAYWPDTLHAAVGRTHRVDRARRASAGNTPTVARREQLKQHLAYVAANMLALNQSADVLQAKIVTDQLLKKGWRCHVAGAFNPLP